MRLYRAIILLCLLSIAVHISLLAQSDSLPAFNTLRTPTSPAFILMGVAPTNVERPNTPKDFAISLLNRTNSFSALPQDFAMEFSPYWMFAGTQEEWRNDITRDIPKSILKTGTLSLATAQISTDTSKKVTGLSVGFRFSLVSGTLAAKSVQKIERIEATLQEELFIKQSMESKERKKIDSLGINNIISPDEYERRKNAIADSIDSSQEFQRRIKPVREERVKLLSQFQENVSTREGLFWELAGAAVWAVPNGVIDKGMLDRLGLWTTLSQQWKEISLIAVGRYISVSTDALSKGSIDLGARCIYTKDRYGISLEYVWRTQVGAKDSNIPQWRLVGGIDYLIAPDTWAVVSFGKDYNTQAAGSLVAQLGLTFNIGKDRFTLPTGQPSTTSEQSR